MKSLWGFLRKNPWKKETILAYYYSARFRLQLLLKTPEKMRKDWGRENGESAETEAAEAYLQAARIARIVRRVCDKTPWESKCLVRALSAQRLLLHRGLSSTLYLGCGMEEGKMVAHAWLRCGEMYVTGGDGSGYTTVARFCKDASGGGRSRKNSGKEEGDNHVSNLGNRGSVSRTASV